MQKWKEDEDPSEEMAQIVSIAKLRRQGEMR
jgi:hypothetical protein